MSRRTTMGGPLSSSSSSLNIDANSRKSLGGSGVTKAASTKSRQSMAPSSSSSSGAATSRMSMAPSSSRQSMGGGAIARGSEARTSLGARNAATDRKSGGGRRSSVGAGARGASSSAVRSDPRPLSDKSFVKENIRKIIVYLTSHHYTHQIAPKQLSSPSTKDFKNIILFLFQQLDRNFVFGSTDPVTGAAISFEDSVKNYMKRFGYPFNISKNALQAAGSPHTWPSLLAMLVWLVEFLQYHENVYGNGSTAADGSVIGGGVANESEKRMFFEYASGAYLAFLQGEDNFSVFDEALARKFEIKNAAVADEISKLLVRNDEASSAIQAYNSSVAALSELIKFRDACSKDVPTLEENIRNNTAYLESIRNMKVARATELEARRGVLAACEAERVELGQILAAQAFTPLQVQEMLHQKTHLTTQLSDQALQQSSLQNEIWAREMDLSKKIQEIERATSEFNDASQQLAHQAHKVLSASSSSTDSSAPIFEHQELRFNPQAEQASSMLNLDLRAHKDSVQSTKDALLVSKKDVSLELKKQAPTLAALQELEAERLASVDTLSKRSAKIHDLYAEERAKMHRVVESSCVAVEDVELDIVKLRNALSGMALEGVAAQQALALDEQIARAEANQLAEEAALKAEICQMMQELTEHKVAITERLEQMLAQAEGIKNKIKATEVIA